MFVLRAGCKVPFPEKLSEEYMLIENQIIANISADKIKDIMNHLCLNQMIISKNPQFTGISARQQLEFTTHLLLTD